MRDVRGGQSIQTIRVVIPAYNVGPWARELVESIKAQELPGGWQLEVNAVDDASADDTGDKLRAAGIDAASNLSRRGAMANLDRMICAAHPDDVIVTLDGDDRLLPGALARVIREHESGAWVTWGSFRTSNGDRGSAPLPESVLRYGHVRAYPWVTSHLRSFRAWLYRRIDVRDLQNEYGQFLRTGWDVPMMCAMIELAGMRARFIPDELYWYRLHPGNDHATDRQAQVQVEMAARRLPRYSVLEHRGSETMRQPVRRLFGVLQGGLGNQLFQIHAVVDECERRNLLGGHWEPAFARAQLHPELAEMMPPEHIHEAIVVDGTRMWRETSFRHRAIPEDAEAVQGYFQSWRYLTHAAVPDYLPWPFMAGNYGTIHVRRGDYLTLPDHHPALDVAYYERAMQIVNAAMARDGVVVPLEWFICSDDPHWCREHLGHLGATVREGHSAMEDLRFMANSQASIIANSSFSWWGAYLASNGYTVAPAQWFGPALAHHDTSDLLPPSWVTT